MKVSDVKGKTKGVLRPFAHMLWKLISLELRGCIIQSYYCKHWPNLKHPKTYNEKLLAYMQSDLMSSYYRFADKIMVREYVKNVVGEQYLTQLYGVYTSYEDIDFCSLPHKFYLKTNHGCGEHLPCADKKLFLQHDADNSTAMRKVLQKDYSLINGERQYHKIKPKIFAEEFLPVVFPRDTVYRFYVFEGKVQGIQVACTLNNDPSRIVNNMYTSEWERAPFSIGYPGIECFLPKPRNLGVMVKVAEKLAVPFPFVRVDLYNLAGRIVFSELTFTPLSAFGPLLPREWGTRLGKLFPWPMQKFRNGDEIWHEYV